MYWRTRICFLVIFFSYLLVFAPASSFAEHNEAETLVSLEIEELLETPVTITGHQEQSVFGSAAAVFILTNDDIRRSGANSIPELLRLIPGVQVARISAHSYAISIRGFSSTLSNKFLLLIDGRSMFSSFHGGVYWDRTDTLISDIERIEVVRGPGAVRWGVNAVNGVINIVTRSSEQTQGTQTVIGVGDEEKQASFRHGMSLGGDWTGRVYVKGRSFDESVRSGSIPADDDWRDFRSGFRFDGSISENDHLTFLGDVYGIDEDQDFLPEASEGIVELPGTVSAEISGGFAGVKWTRNCHETECFSAHLFADRTDRDEPFVEIERNALKGGFHHFYTPSAAHRLTWGSDFEYNRERIGDGVVQTKKGDDAYGNIGFFFEDSIQISEDLTVSPGLRIVYNDFTGTDYQPIFRTAWKADEDTMAWFKIARSVSLPFRMAEDTDVFVPDANAESDGLPAFLEVMGSNNLSSSKVTTFEIGTRTSVFPSATLDVATFYNHYDALYAFEELSPEIRSTPEGDIFVTRFTTVDKNSADSFGGEIIATWKPVSNLLLQAWYAYNKIDFHSEVAEFDGGSLVPFGGDSDRQTADHQALLRSQMTLYEKFEFDYFVRYLDNLAATDIDSYIELNARIGYRAMDNVEISLSGANLFNSSNEEYPAEPTIRVERAVFGSIKVTY